MTLSLPTFNQTSALLAHNTNDTQHNSRKRQRSLSMQSNASSPKRSVSEDPFQDSPRDNSFRDNSAVHVLHSSDFPSNATLSDVDMSTQDDPLNRSSQSPLISLDLSTVDPLLKRPLQPGEFWYIISKRWLDRWRKACTGQLDKEDGVILESDLGPPDKDNQAYIDENNHLLTSISAEDVELIPQEVWDYFIAR
jgi:ubiquitin carboxyl-terminal hydrolase 4/11